MPKMNKRDRKKVRKKIKKKGIRIPLLHDMKDEAIMKAKLVSIVTSMFLDAEIKRRGLMPKEEDKEEDLDE